MQGRVEVSDDTLTARQKDVLDAALGLLVEGGDALTMTGVARRASCSKETLYKWFGDRDGLLTATVQWQASKVRVAPVTREGLNAKSLFTSLEGFARDWLTVLSGEISVTLNRIAITHAATGKSDLGAIVLTNGPFAMARRLKPVLEIGREAGLLSFKDTDEAFRTFFGLVVRDMQIRLLLGDRLELTEAAIARDAERATQQFFALYGATSETAAGKDAGGNTRKGIPHARLL
ncbi:TetR family transcriptional regulator [Paramesorhizobium deserti]|uniref:TetR family transcriptional regulator n=1 Tax=Paramesorhizobium deserti TaxID=1494590 RepID=A0A135HUK5_9HYPH|nr:TetR/AcrR family transcriptional regulator C-terminal domain-containing protein [Paramesorhizobium deserti]KXF76872.1 TetR family transcriptional regulator [Paramesorhizobium deserti]